MTTEENLIRTMDELEERLSRPTTEDAEALSNMEGDLLILGVGGKMGPSLARLARRAASMAGVDKRIIAVARFSNRELRSELEKDGIDTIQADLLDPVALRELPDAPNVVFMAGRKFGTEGGEHLTWAMNAFLPGLVAQRFRSSKIVAFSTGNVYRLRDITRGGCDEDAPISADGEYAQSALGRERILQYGSYEWGTPTVLLRLYYAAELRYGVLVDIALAVYRKQPIDLRNGVMNFIWQRDANSVCLRSFAHCQSPPLVLNISGPETLSVRYIAQQFGQRFGIEPIFTSEETTHALICNSTKAHRLFGYPTVTPQELFDWVAWWISHDGELLNKPTHFDVQDGRF
ncbi:MAG TPA: hypothetical protein VKX41_06335 [Alloacidobacterium sp.]|jgi:nucleoside-diphosphate-sugar epimerase|nr:hypothetical protein [Alloacidobacterium sp.]